jgi:hypothetical protein
VDTQAEDTKEDTREDNRDEKLLERVKRRFKYMSSADDQNRQDAMEDLKFVNVPGAQWDDKMKQERGNRPCYEFNKLRVTGKRVINDIRANRPQGKVRGYEGGDKDIAEIYEGLIRNLWNVSDGDTVVDYATEYQVNAGMGCWRVSTEYGDDNMFEQDIVLQTIQNPFCLYADPGCKDSLKRDAEDWILTEKISFKTYEKRFPKEKKFSFEELEFDDDDWIDEESVRIAEYWYKEPAEKELWQLQDGTVVDSTTDEGQAIAKDPQQIAENPVVKTRSVVYDKIMWCIASGSKIIEGPSEWAGKLFPFVMIYGEYLVIDGKTVWWGLPRFAKDAQRAYNVARTNISESTAQIPKTYFWATAEQAAGLETQWAEAHKKNYPFMLYNPDSKAPGPPQRMGAADIPVALIQESQIASDEIKAVTGIFDASMGNRGNETSGRAIYARQQQGEIATFNYQDNVAKGIRRTYEILIDLIPNVYDTERELRILGSDGSEDYKRVNQVVFDPATGKSMRINDLGQGRYDVTVTVGPNFSTRRQEASEIYGQLAQQFPDLMPIAGDLVFKSMDLPYSEDIAERIQTMLPPQIQELMNQEAPIPPEVQQMMQKAERAMQEVQQYGALVQDAAAELEGEKALNEKQKAEIKTELANVRAARAEFDAHIANELSKLVTKDAGIKVSEAGLQGKIADATIRFADVSSKIGEGLDDTHGYVASETVRSLDQIVANFMEVVDNAMGVMEQKADMLGTAVNKKVVGGITRREGGKLRADVEYDDGTRRSLSAVREGGNLVIEPEADTVPDGG